MTLPLQFVPKSIIYHCNGRLQSPFLALVVPPPLYNNNASTNNKSVPYMTNSAFTANSSSKRLIQYNAFQSKFYQRQLHNLPHNLARKEHSSSSIRYFSSSTSKWAQQFSPSQQLRIQLYQYKICPFCNRVKAVLDYINHTTKVITNHNNNNGTTNTKEMMDSDVVSSSSSTTLISVNNIEVNPLTKTEIKQFTKEYRKVPIATFDNISSSSSSSKTIYGSDEIIHHLLNEYHPSIRHKLEQHWVAQQQQQLSLPSSSSSSSPLMTYDLFMNHDTAKVWTNYAINELAVWLYPNMCRTYRDSLIAFQYIHDPTLQYSTFQRYMIQYIGAFAMTFAANKIKKRHNVTDERMALNDVLDKLENELQRLNPKTSVSDSKYIYLSGTITPNMGDINVYGVLRAIENLPIYQEMILKRRITTKKSTTEDLPPIVEWLLHMSKQVSN